MFFFYSDPAKIKKTYKYRDIYYKQDVEFYYTFLGKYIYSYYILKNEFSHFFCLPYIYCRHFVSYEHFFVPSV